MNSGIGSEKYKKAILYLYCCGKALLGNPHPQNVTVIKSYKFVMILIDIDHKPKC